MLGPRAEPAIVGSGDQVQEAMLRRPGEMLAQCVQSLALGAAERTVKAAHADLARKACDPGGERAERGAVPQAAVRLPQQRLQVLGAAKHEAHMRPAGPAAPQSSEPRPG